MKLDKQDAKLLSHLYHHFRDSNTQIAKSTTLSRDQVTYRINKYEKQGLIKKYATIFNYAQIGYNTVAIVWYRTDDQEKLLATLKNTPEVISCGEALGTYTVFANFMCTNHHEFQQILPRTTKNVQSYETLTVNDFHLFDLKQFGSTKNTAYQAISGQQVHLDDKEQAILRELEKDGKARIVDIAEATGLSSQLVIYKIKQLKEQGTIQGTRIIFDMHQLGMQFAEIQLKLSAIPDLFTEFCKQHPHINAVTYGTGRYNCIVQVLYADDAKLRSTIVDVRKHTKNTILVENLILIQNESRVQTLPRLS